jgi:alpha-N-acetylglucosaminidase
MHNVGGPLPMNFMTDQFELQKQILGRMRELGIVPVLPAFQGNVPPMIATIYTDANITIQGAHWGGGEAAWLDGTDPLFQEIGNRFMKQLIEDFGVDTDGDGVGDETEHWYEADGWFTAGDPPWRRRRLASSAGDNNHPGTYTPERLGNPVDGAFEHATAAYMAMNQTDPEARWMYQGWILDSSEESKEVMEAYSRAVPQGKFLVSDMWAEWAPIWPMLKDAGVPYLAGTLQNFGGNLFMGTSVTMLAQGAPEDPSAAPSIPIALDSSDLAAGVGAFPEGIDQNPAFYTFLFDSPWLADSDFTSLDSWWIRYSTERYGVENEDAAKAWKILGSSVYSIDIRQNATEGGFYRERAKGGLLSAPGVDSNINTNYDSIVWYDSEDVLDAWSSLAAAALSDKGLDRRALAYDLVNTGREFLDKLANGPAQLLTVATTADAIREAGAALMQIQADADELLCSSDAFVAASVFKSAEDIAEGAEQKSFFNSLARAQVTTWLPACATPEDVDGGVCSMYVDGGDANGPPLNDYADKAWGGLIGHYYRARVGCYVEQAAGDMEEGREVDVVAVRACIDKLARDFQADAGMELFGICEEEIGDAAEISQRLMEKYGQVVW